MPVWRQSRRCGAKARKVATRSAKAFNCTTHSLSSRRAPLPSAHVGIWPSFRCDGSTPYLYSANLRSSSASPQATTAEGPPPPSYWPSLLHTSSQKQPGRHRNRRVLRSTSSPVHHLTRPQAAVRDSTSTTLRFIYLSSSARQPQLCFTTATGPCSSAYRIPQARNFCTYRTIPCRRRHPELPAKYTIRRLNTARADKNSRQ